MSLLQQYGYYQQKALWDVLSGGISITVIEKVFSLLEKKMSYEYPLALLGISKNTNTQIIRFLRMIFEPAVILTVLNSLQLLMFGEAGDYSGGVFLAGVAMASMEDYYRTFRLFVSYWHKYLYDEVSQLEAEPRLPLAPEENTSITHAISTMGGRSGVIISGMGGAAQ